MHSMFKARCNRLACRKAWATRRQYQLKDSYERYPLSRLAELLRRHVIDEIIFAVDSSKLSEMEDVFLRCDEEGVRTRVVVDFFPRT